MVTCYDVCYWQLVPRVKVELGHVMREIRHLELQKLTNNRVPGCLEAFIVLNSYLIN